MKERAAKILTASIVLAVIICICVFSFLAVYMNHRNSETIKDVGQLYMSGMNERITKHYETMIDLQFSQVDFLEDLSREENVDEEELHKILSDDGASKGFESLAFYYGDGDFDMIYGSEFITENEEPFMESLKEGKNKVAAGKDSEGDSVLILGVPYEGDQRREGCVAMVATLPLDYVAEALSLDDEGTLVYSFIIRTDGSFVIRSYDAFRDSYFQRVRELYDETDGMTTEDFIKQLQASMEIDEPFSAEISSQGELRHIYCSTLPKSEWYLVTIMPYGAMNEKVEKLGEQWIYMVLGGGAVILLAMLIVFLQYIRMNRRQLKDLEETKLLAEEANRAKSEFLSNMSHDIRTPMNAIVGMAAIGTANIDNKEQVSNCLKKITLSGRHLLGLINDILDMSKIESGKMTLSMERVSLREVIESIVSIVQPLVKSKNQNFDVFIEDVVAENIWCDSMRLSQVMLNLLSNAVKFTPEEGNIQVFLREETSPLGDEHVRLRLQVKDSGIGISEEFQARIFDSFSREDRERVHKMEGTGLGMAITKCIIDAMDGTIEVKSRQGEGTCFDITLDVKKAPAAAEQMVLPPWDMLVVDDDKQLCESTVASLESIGIHGDWVLDGETAVEMIRQHHEEHRDYQIILLDWKLPGMDGIETARRIRSLLGDDIPILLISAYDWSEIEEDAKAAGVTGFIPKPLFRSTLFYGLKSYMCEESSESGGQENTGDFRGMHILLAEDNELNWEVAAALLEDLGLELEWAEDGKICVEKFQASPEGFYDAVLMDLRMPRMNGYEATKEIRALSRADADIPIIAMTADAFAEDVQRCLDCGMNAHIAKPIDVAEVAKVLERCIEK